MCILNIFWLIVGRLTSSVKHSIDVEDKNKFNYIDILLRKDGGMRQSGKRILTPKGKEWHIQCSLFVNIQ